MSEPGDAPDAAAGLPDEAASGEAVPATPQANEPAWSESGPWGAPGTERSADDTAASATPGTELRTFLIADIRGYTAYTSENGDEAAAALATRFGELVGEVATARDGFLLELRGDEALVVFVSARKALRAAIDLQARIATEKLPRGIGIGLDAGEAIPVGTGYRGTALNLAARLCAKAGPGETLASEAVIHLAAKMEGIEYVDAHEVKVKGYDEAVRVVVVVPTEQAKGRRTGSARRLIRAGPAQYAILGVAVLVVALVVAAMGGGLFGAAHPSPATAAVSPSPTPDPLGDAELPVLAFYDATTAKLQATTHLAKVRNISFWAGGSFWSLAEDPRAMYRIDPETHQITQGININLPEASGYTVDDDYIFVTDLGAPQMTRIDARTSVPKTFTVADPKNPDDQAVAVDVTTGAGSVWLSRPDVDRGNGDTGEITRVDRVTGEVQARIPISAFGLTFGAGGLWWWKEGTLGVIDPATNQETFKPVELATDTWLGNIYIGGNDAWTSSASTGRVWRIDRSGRSTMYNLPPGVSELAATDKKMWATNATAGQLIGIDFATGQQDRHIDTGHATVAVAAHGNELMVAVEPTVDEYIAGLSGSVLSLAADGQPWWDPAPDPPLVGNQQVRQLLYLTCAGLLGYPDKPGAAGRTPVPEVAAGPPTVSGDGKTYTVTIQPGFKFSPPSNEEVTAETFRYTLERAVSPVYGDDAPGVNFFGDIAGVKEFREGTADHVSGLEVAGNQLRITLVAPAPTLTTRLASWIACPVPLTTPPLHSGLNPDPPVGGDGPYYLAQKVPKWLVIFKKNPNYHGPRPQPWDAIAVRVKTSPATAIAMVENGKVDGAFFDGPNPIAAPGSSLAEDWGPGSAHASEGDQRWFAGPTASFDYIALNPNRKAFKDPAVRRAVALAVDRAAFATIWTNQALGTLLPQPVPGSPGDAVKPPDLDAARALLKGHAPVDVTLLGFPEDWGCSPCHEFDLALVGQLKAIGVNVTIKPGDPADYPGGAYTKDSGVDMVVWGTGTDIVDPVEVLNGLHDVGWLGDANVAELDGLNTLNGQRRVDGAAAFANRIANEDALVVPADMNVFPFFTSARIGCGFVQDAIGGVDLLSLCVKDTGGASATPSATASP